MWRACKKRHNKKERHNKKKGITIKVEHQFSPSEIQVSEGEF